MVFVPSSCSQLLESNVVAPSSLKISRSSSIGDNTVAGLLDESAECGAATYFGMDPFINVNFDHPHVFTKLEVKCHMACYDGPNRLNGTDLSYKLNDTDQWTPVLTINDVKGGHFVHIYEFGDGINAKFWRLSKKGNNDFAIGMARFYAIAPFTPIITKKGQVYTKEQELALSTPAYTGPDVNVIEPVKIGGSKIGSWSGIANTIEGLLDDTGNHGYSTTGTMKAHIILSFDAPYVAKYIEYMTHIKYGDSNQIAHLKNIDVFYKSKDYEGWKLIDMLPTPKPNRHINTMSFGGDGLVIKHLKFELRSGSDEIIFGMLRVYALAPYREIKTKTGIIPPLVKPVESEIKPPVVSSPVVETVVQQVVIQPNVPSTPPVSNVVSQPTVSVTSSPVIQPVVAAQSTPVSTPVAQPMIEEAVVTTTEVNVIEPASLKFSSTSYSDDNTVQGLLDESAGYGARTYFGMDSYIDVNFDKPHIFKYIEIKAHSKASDSDLKLNNVKISCKLNSGDQWTNVTTLNGLNGDLHTNTIQLNDLKAQFWRFSKGGMDNVVLGMVRFYGLSPYIPIKTMNGTILRKEEELALMKPSYTGNEINVVAPLRITGSKTDRNDNTIEGLLDDTADYGYTTERVYGSHMILNFDAVYVFKHFEFIACPMYGDSPQRDYLNKVEVHYKVREFEPWIPALTLENVKINRVKNTIQLAGDGVTAKYWKFSRPRGTIERISFGMLRMYALAPYIAYKTKTGEVLTREAELAKYEPQYTGNEINLVAPVSFTSTMLDDYFNNTIPGLLDESGMFGMGTTNTVQPRFSFDFGQVFKFRYMELFAHQNFGFNRGSEFLKDVNVSYKLKESEPWTLFTTIQNVGENGEHTFVKLNGTKARYWKFDRPHSGDVCFGMLKMFAYAPYTPIQNLIGVIPPKKEIGASYLSTYQGTEVNVVPVKLLSSSNPQIGYADNCISGMLDSSCSFGVCAINDLYIHKSSIEIEYEQAHLFKRVEFLTHSLYEKSYQALNVNNVTLYYKVRKEDPWILLTTLNNVKTHPKLNVLQFPQTEEYDGTINDGVKARYWKLERGNGQNIVLGMFRLYALAPYTPIETKYKTIIQENEKLDEQSILGDEKSLIDYYNKFIEQNHKEVIDKPIQTPKPIDPSTLKVYSDSGDSDIRLRIPSLARLSDRHEFFCLLQNIHSQRTVGNEPSFECNFTLTKVYFVNSSSTPLSVTKIMVEYKDSNGNWVAMDGTQAGYNDGVLVLKEDPFSFKIIAVKDYNQVNEVFLDTFNIGAGATLEYFVTSELPCKGLSARMKPADRYLPTCYPNPLQVRLSIEDSKGKKRELEMTYVVPYSNDLPLHTEESFNNVELNGLNDRSVCMVYDTVNRVQAFAYQCMNNQRKFLSLGMAGPKGFLPPKRITMQEIKYNYEVQQQESVLIHSEEILPTFKVTFNLLCDKDNGYRAYATHVIVSSLTGRIFRNSNSSAFKHSKNGAGSGADLLEDSSTLGSNEAEPPNPSKNRSGSTHSNSSSSSDRSVPSTSPSSSHMVHSHSKQSTTTNTSHKQPHHSHHHHKSHNDKKKRRALNFLNNIPTEHVNRDSHAHTQSSGTILKPTITDSSSGGGGSRSHAISSSPPNLITTTTKSAITNVSPRPRGYTASSRLESPTEDKSNGAYTIVVSSTTATTTTILENSSSNATKQHSSKLTVNIPNPEPKTIANPIVDGSEQKPIEQNDQLTSKTKLHNNNNDKKLPDHHHHHRYNQLHHPHPKHHHHAHKTKTKALDFLSNIPMKKVESLENVQESQQKNVTQFTLKTSNGNTSTIPKTLPKFLKQINTMDEVFDSTNESPDIENQKEVDESNEDDYIRRLHLMQKNSSIPFLVCSFIKPKKNPSTFPNSSTGSTPLPTSATSIPTLCSPVVDHTLVDVTLTSEELISKQMELEAITVSKKPTSYRSYILEPLKCEAYDPLFLDDPNIRTASKRKVMTFPGLMTSTIPFLKSKALKKDLNEQFRQQHEHCLLSLSKIRKLKRRILKVILKQKPDELTIAALAYVYLEKMILKNLVHKTNRKRIAAACLFLAFKMTLESTHEQRKEMISDFLDEIESVFEVGRKKVVQTEFFVMSEGLHFNMNTDIRDIQPHLQRLLDEDQDRQVLFNRSLNRV
ncbi:hypothetical protein NAEGRDRAFT_58254 [Naegleria gruberi]|uniref:Uncharacterized protein AM28 n=1 Tax=Naegleria gruberi TaxID=5762 RepID=D2VHS6_NAEGR|nr:uncharacterized protein NAEGRDRAFT_58254 [Naegleria gruberi]EFC43725.1 hypothetical protein NAEGRDRAFT_58254 [Naegleria gruberi]|eukprot:XP_002676469.1 hypothetical protein NAEGRDRAFT_58254 [Naegleria gruberi strain NEG-M]